MYVFRCIIKGINIFFLFVCIYIYMVYGEIVIELFFSCFESNGYNLCDFVDEVDDWMIVIFMKKFEKCYGCFIIYFLGILFDGGFLKFEYFGLIVKFLIFNLFNLV